MPLKDRLAALDNQPSRAPGVVQKWINTLSAEDQELVFKYLKTHNSEISHLSLLHALQEEGAPFGKEALVTYRKNLWKNNG